MRVECVGDADTHVDDGVRGVEAASEGNGEIAERGVGVETAADIRGARADFSRGGSLGPCPGGRLEQGGATLDQVVKVTSYRLGMKNFEEMNKGYGQYFTDLPPAR